MLPAGLCHCLGDLFWQNRKQALLAGLNFACMKAALVEAIVHCKVRLQVIGFRATTQTCHGMRYSPRVCTPAEDVAAALLPAASASCCRRLMTGSVPWNVSSMAWYSSWGSNCCVGPWRPVWPMPLQHQEGLDGIARALDGISPGCILVEPAAAKSHTCKQWPLPVLKSPVMVLRDCHRHPRPCIRRRCPGLTFFAPLRIQRMREV